MKTITPAYFRQQSGLKRFFEVKAQYVSHKIVIFTKISKTSAKCKRFPRFVEKIFKKKTCKRRKIVI